MDIIVVFKDYTRPDNFYSAVTLFDFVERGKFLKIVSKTYGLVYINTDEILRVEEVK